MKLDNVKVEMSLGLPAEAGIRYLVFSFISSPKRSVVDIFREGQAPLFSRHVIEIHRNDQFMMNMGMITAGSSSEFQVQWT